MPVFFSDVRKFCFENSFSVDTALGKFEAIGELIPRASIGELF